MYVNKKKLFLAKTQWWLLLDYLALKYFWGGYRLNWSLDLYIYWSICFSDFHCDHFCTRIVQNWLEILICQVQSIYKLKIYSSFCLSQVVASHHVTGNRQNGLVEKWEPEMCVVFGLFCHWHQRGQLRIFWLSGLFGFRKNFFV